MAPKFKRKSQKSIPKIAIPVRKKLSTSRNPAQPDASEGDLHVDEDHPRTTPPIHTTPVEHRALGRTHLSDTHIIHDHVSQPCALATETDMERDTSGFDTQAQEAPAVAGSRVSQADSGTHGITRDQSQVALSSGADTITPVSIVITPLIARHPESQPSADQRPKRACTLRGDRPLSAPLPNFERPRYQGVQGDAPGHAHQAAVRVDINARYEIDYYVIRS